MIDRLLNFGQESATMIWLKGCPRCGGDLFEEHLESVADIKCLQCSRILNEAQRLLVLDRTRQYFAARASGAGALRVAS
jgi:hypothetical protein